MLESADQLHAASADIAVKAVVSKRSQRAMERTISVARFAFWKNLRRLKWEAGNW
jgi:hypothetical protein